MAIPKSAARWNVRLDPGDLLDFEIDWRNLLQADSGEAIDPANWQIITSAEATLLGFRVQDGARSPQLFDLNRQMKMWFGVEPGNQNDVGWNAGADCAIKVVFRTTANPYRQYERTFVVRVENR